MEAKTRVNRRTFLRMTAIGSAGAVVVACTPAPAPQPTTAPVGQATTVPAPTAVTEPVTLRYTYVADPGEMEIRQACIADFQTKYPSIQITGELIPEDGMAQKILTQLAGGAAPDLVYFNNTPLPFYASQNVFVPLDDYAAKDAEFGLDDFFPGPLTCLSYGGKIYGFPYYSGPGFIHFNKTLFEEAGVPDPTTFEEGFQDGEDTWTWDKLLETARQVTKGEGAQKVFGFMLDRYYDDRCVWLPAWGGNRFNDDLTKCLLDSPESIAGHQFQIDMLLKWKVSPSLADLEGMPDKFVSGRIAMCRGIRAHVPGHRDGAKFNIGQAPMPKGPMGRFTFDGPNAVGLVSTCKDKEAGWTFCRYMPGVKPGDLGGQEFEFKANRSIPTRKSNFQSKVFLDNLLPWEDGDVYLDAAQHVFVPPKIDRESEFEKAWKEAFDAMALGKPVPEALKDLVAAVEPLLKQ